MKDRTISYMENFKVIFTGGSGLLGTAMKKLRPEFLYPTHDEFDVTDFDLMAQYIEYLPCVHIVHAASFISPPKIEANPIKAIEINIIGTSNVVKLCAEYNLKFTYISTDYVFSGEKGNYKETDDVNPTNKYAWSKLGGECAARLYDKSLIIRTSFGPDIFPYDKAFGDQWTSRESVSEISKKISSLIDKDIYGVVHVGGERRTVLEYARSLSSDKVIGEISIKDRPFKTPVDASLNTDYFKSL